MLRFLRIILLAVALVSAACTSLPPSQTTAQTDTVRVKLIAFNDFHGGLLAPPSGVRAPSTLDPTKDVIVPAGGVARLASLVNQLKAQNPNNAVVAAGDLIGATPLESSMFLDEPSIEALNAVGLEFSSVGNHEFDQGVAELKRKQNGGCEVYTGEKPCKAGHHFEGARFSYLAANVIQTSSGQPLFPPYRIKSFDGVPVAFIGLTLQTTDQLAAPQNVKGLEFRDEADTINALLPELRAQGVKTFVVLIHQGAYFVGRFNDARCLDLNGPILGIIDRLDPAISVVISGHTHQAYACDYNKVLLTSSWWGGRVVTDIDLEIERSSGRVISKNAINRIVTSNAYEGAPLQPGYLVLDQQPAVDALVQRYVALAEPLVNRPLGRITETLKKNPDRATANDIESALCDVVADSQWAGTRAAGARFALMNPAGVRVDLDYGKDGVVRYGDLFRAQPFANRVMTMTLTGAQIKAVLEQQWTTARSYQVILCPSSNFTFAFDATRPPGARVLEETIRLDGKLIEAGQRYRVTVNEFIGVGGDGFTVLNDGTDRVIGLRDIELREAWFKAQSPIAPPPLGRVIKLTLPLPKP